MRWICPPLSSQAGAFLGYHLTVCDARPVFATPARFPHADEAVTNWPHRYLEHTEIDARTAVCVLTHDAKFDIPLLSRALQLRVAYVGPVSGTRCTRCMSTGASCSWCAGCG
ncbi:XdhC family protein [Streptomyces sp. KR55]|uniref:XdhC family protein n=1 Tax=Streptomyces sp. KR55 TaxID=3457425 RepID=UPI003FCFB81F